MCRKKQIHRNGNKCSPVIIYTKFKNVNSNFPEMFIIMVQLHVPKCL